MSTYRQAIPNRLHDLHGCSLLHVELLMSLQYKHAIKNIYAACFTILAEINSNTIGATLDRKILGNDLVCYGEICWK
jgi:uncharacterized membrane protein